MLIMLIAILVRVIEFGNIPGGLNQDEARTAIDAKAILEYGTDVFGISNPAWLSTMVEANHQSVMLAWLQMPFIKVFGFSVFSPANAYNKFIRVGSTLFICQRHKRGEACTCRAWVRGYMSLLYYEKQVCLGL